MPADSPSSDLIPPEFEAPESEPAWLWRPFFRGLANGAGLPGFILMCSLIGVGGLCRDVGYPMGAAVLSTFLVWAGPAQVLLFGSIAAGVPLVAIGAAISLSSIRFIPMCMSLLPLLRRPGMPVWAQLGLVHFIAATAWFEGQKRLPGLPRAERAPYFLGFSLSNMLLAAFATGAGYFLIAQLPPVLAAALLFTTPIFFTVSLVAGTRIRMDFVPIALGFLGAPVAAALVPAGLDLMLAGVGGGTLAYLVMRAMRRPA